MAEFRMPSLGADMEAGTLVAWRKRPGDRVARGDIVAEVETDKGIVEVEVFTSGSVETLLVTEGTKVPVGTPLALIREDGSAASPPSPPQPTPGTDRTRASPAARRLAGDLGVDLTAVAGTGRDGAVTLDDVRRKAGGTAETPDGTRDTPGARAPTDDARIRMRHAIAAAMTRSNREIPHYYVSHTVDVTPLLDWLEQYNRTAAMPDRLIPAVPFLKAVALALRDFPDFNGSWVDDRLVPNRDIHLGAAVALRGGGLVAPALRNTDQIALPDLMHRFRDLVTRTRAGTLRSSEMSDATVTVTSLGDRGAESVLGVIYPPQVALIGFGRIVERPWVVDGTVVPRRVVHLSLAADHRATDGHAGALFLSAIADKLKEPSQL